jgi:hypothetical protein
MPHGHTSWVRLATPGLEVYTTADEDAGRSLILRLERLRSVLQPILGWDQLEKPICIIEFGSREEFLPFAPMSRSIGYFLPGARRDFVVLDGTHAEGRAAGHEYVHFVWRRTVYGCPHGSTKDWRNCIPIWKGHNPASEQPSDNSFPAG